MFDPPYYIPILKLKAAELDALMAVQDRVSNVVPFLDIAPLKLDGRGREEIAPTVKWFMEEWEAGEAILIDAMSLDYHYPKFEDALKRIADRTADLPNSFIPVTGPERSNEYQAAARYALNANNRGICIRLRAPTLHQEHLQKTLRKLTSYLDVEFSMCDLLIDYEVIYRKHHPTYAHDFERIVRTLPFLHEWRSLTVAATSYPARLADYVSPDKEGIFTREAWQLYKKLGKPSVKKKFRLPGFADYGVSSPEMAAYRGPIPIDIAPTVVYTTAEEYVMLRSDSASQKSISDQYRRLSTRLTRREEFSARETWANNTIRSLSCGEISNISDPLTWDRVETARHIEKTASQIGQLSCGYGCDL